jgi:hypothetical protein
MWLVYLNLWKEYLLQTCSEAIGFCEEKGFLLVPSFLRAEICMKKGDESIFWRGGWKGEATFLEKEGQMERYVLCKEREDLTSVEMFK